MSKHHQVVTLYMTEHGYIPLWVLVNLLTFGKIENFYKNMKPADKTTVAKQFNLQPDELAKFMHMLALLLSKSDLNDFISSMRTAFGKLQKQLHTISVADIISIMGYDANWTNLANLI